MALVDEITIFLFVVYESHSSLKRLFLLSRCCFKAEEHIDKLGYVKEHWENEDVDVNKIAGFCVYFLGEDACLICKEISVEEACKKWVYAMYVYSFMFTV